LISKADGNLKKRLEAELEPFMRFFTGKELELYDRAVFVLSDIPSNFVRDGVAFLLLALVWSTVKQDKYVLEENSLWWMKLGFRGN